MAEKGDGAGCVGAGARGAVRQSCSRPRKPARKEALRGCPIVPLSGVPIATVRTISSWLTAYRRAHDTQPRQRHTTTAPHRRQGLHRTGHDHPEEKTRPAPPSRRQGLQHHRQPDPLQDRESHRQHPGPGAPYTPATEDH